MKGSSKQERLWQGDLEDLDWSHWNNYRDALPETDVSVRRLGRTEFHRLLAGWIGWADKEDAIMIWKEIWSKSNKEQRRRLIEKAVDQGIFKPQNKEEENRLKAVLVSSGDETFLSGAFSFWLYYYKVPRGIIRRYLGTLALLSRRGERKRGFWETLGLFRASGDLERLQVRFLIASWCVWILLLLFSILNPSVVEFFEQAVTSELPDESLWITFLIAGIVGIIAGGLWYIFVEKLAVRELDIDPTAPLLYPGLVFVAGSALMLLGVSQDSFAHTVLLFLFLSLLALWLWKSIPLWVRVLAFVLVVAFAFLLSPIVYVKELTLGWMVLLAGDFATLRLWWLSLDFYDKSQEGKDSDRSSDRSKEGDGKEGRKGLWEKLVGWVFPDDYKTDQVVLTPILIIALLLTNLLWFHSLLIPDVIAMDSAGLVTIVHPPWLSTEDQGVMEVRFTNPLPSPQTYTVTVSSNPSGQLAASVYSNGSKDGLAVGHTVATIPSSSQANFYFTVETDPVSSSIHLTDLFKGWEYNFEVTVEGEKTPSQTEDLSISVPSLYLPSLYASASTFQGWFLRSFWAFAQVLAAAFFAARVDRRASNQ